MSALPLIALVLLAVAGEMWTRGMIHVISGSEFEDRWHLPHL